jgi:hypothetical protein
MAFLRINTNHFDLSKVDQLLEPSFQAALREGLPAQTGLRYAVAGRDAEKVTTVTVWDTREHAEPGVPLGELEGKLVAMGWTHGDPQVTEVFIESEAAVPA